ncbi:MAG: DegT/DnrJ/EryC1/StrS family aminotransferase [Bacteroidetes bacterium]|nr:DegT/DnrJ/EryC1/StrS family aminotransferase [Rhodothermia bacterium]MCS7154967.1 DegT/DnrJ/EryC1/StrS family aminotransferase [Bacteroidota bacterium]MCX7907251.1 DegT/DnrJ/EryC1/StrS family aminotransferase [Bacteroidota bacterium]MDW8138023.1 DegT/DnrJ/EryC1/StrS family aminotransferase [Bacteroidota bacterium]MDW8286125.1 DegT/DnrJ/EryC1/StrS family aminotransferase [Bacteroidota bacterium]
MDKPLTAPQIQMVDLLGQHRRIRDELLRAIEEVLDGGQYIRGPQCERFEANLAAYLGCRYAIGCASGTDALLIALMAIGLRPGEEVITTPFTFVATAEMIALLGARPVYADIDPRTFNLDPADVAARIGPRTRAIIPVHLYGQPADMDAILDLASRHGLYVIEDAAQAIGAEWRGRKVGTLGHVGCISFFPSKNLGALGDGGAVVTNDPGLAQRMRMIANHGARIKYHHELVGLNSRLDTLQAALLDVKLRYLEAYLAARQEAAARYDALLADIPEIVLPFRDERARHVFHQYTIRASDRDRLRAFLEARGVPTMIYYPLPLHLQPAYRHHGYAEGDFPQAERAAREVLSLPMHTELNEAQLQHIADSIRAFYGR